MKRSILPAIILSLSLASAAWALPASPNPAQNQFKSTNLVEVGYKDKEDYKGYKRNYSKNYNWNKHRHNNYAGTYRYGNRYWGHRYNYRPYGWQTLGCIAVGPIWYCP